MKSGTLLAAGFLQLIATELGIDPSGLVALTTSGVGRWLLAAGFWLQSYGLILWASPFLMEVDCRVRMKHKQFLLRSKKLML